MSRSGEERRGEERDRAAARAAEQALRRMTRLGRGGRRPRFDRRARARFLPAPWSCRAVRRQRRFPLPFLRAAIPRRAHHHGYFRALFPILGMMRAGVREARVSTLALFGTGGACAHDYGAKRVELRLVLRAETPRVRLPSGKRARERERLHSHVGGAQVPGTEEHLGPCRGTESPHRVTRCQW